MSIEEDLQKFIASDILRVGVSNGPGVSENLADAGLLDSLGLLQTLDFIQRNYSVDLLTAGNPEDYSSIENMANAVRRLRKPLPE